MIPAREFSSIGDLVAHYKGVRERVYGARTPVVFRRPAPPVVVEPLPPAIEAEALKVLPKARPAVDLEAIERMAAAIARSAVRVTPAPPLEFVVAMSCIEHQVPVLEVKSHRRHKTIIPARRAYCWLARELTYCSFPEIGRALGGRDHTTILHHVRKADAMRDVNPEYRAALDGMKDRFSARWTELRGGGEQ